MPQHYRMVIDYKEINLKIAKIPYPLPVPNESFSEIGPAKLFSTIDLSNGFHQLRCHPAHTHKTAFTSPMGRHEFLVLPFGIKNGPPVFQKLINIALKKYLGKICFCFMDDILISA